MPLRPHLVRWWLLSIALLACAELRAGSPCARPAAPLPFADSRWNGFGADAQNSRAQPAPGFGHEQLSSLNVRWAYAYPGPIAGAQPTLFADRLYVASITGEVSALDAATGCVYFTYRAAAAVRTSILVAVAPLGVPARYLAYFGDDNAYAHAIDAETGALIWRTRVDLHAAAQIRAAPTMHDGRLFVAVASREDALSQNVDYACCTQRGSLAALDASSGRLLWKRFTIETEALPLKPSARQRAPRLGPAGGAISATPTIDAERQVIYVAAGRALSGVSDDANTIRAYDLKTGQLKWRAAPRACDGNTHCSDEIGAPLILKTLPNSAALLLAGQRSGVVYALAADGAGRIVWRSRVSAGSDVGGVGMAADDAHVYVATSDVLNTQSAMPGLTALRIETGATVWYVPTPAAQCSFTGGRCVRGQSAAVTVMPGAVLSGSLDGKLRAYSAADGQVLWQFDTGGVFPTVNGGPTSGGNLDGGGPVLAGGRLAVNSGYDSPKLGGFGRVLLMLGVH